MPSVTLASRTFDWDAQSMFAALSGDFNPVHLDPIAARKTQAGAAVVHGIHATLWALDKLFETGFGPEEIATLRAQFRNFIPVGKRVELKLLGRDDKSVRIELCLGNLPAVTLVVGLGGRKLTAWSEVPYSAPRTSVKDQPANLVRFDAIAKQSGWLDNLRADEMQRHFPYISSAVGSSRVAGIAHLSRLVGMICPGLHSLFGGFALELVDNSRHHDCFGFQVTSTDERFRMVRMSVSGAGLCGSVQAFLRWPPIAQPSLNEIMKLVDPTEFAGSTALIIGGSRGLGALTAKILGAGGAKVLLTYATGQSDAAEVVEEIRSQTARHRCEAFRYSTDEEPAIQLKAFGAGVTHLYYFATSNIARQKQSPFVTSLFDEFVQMYVKGFHDCCRYLSEHGAGRLTAFYPSSIFVESNPPDMAEYCMAKMAGEVLCANMNRSDGSIRIIVSRLPRLLTDQTATVLAGEMANSLQVMLPIVRNVQLSHSVH